MMITVQKQGCLDERVKVLLLPNIVTEIDHVIDPKPLSMLVQGRALWPVPDDPAGDRQSGRVKECHTVEKHVDVLVRQQSPDGDEVDAHAIGMGILDGFQVDPVRHD